MTSSTTRPLGPSSVVSGLLSSCWDNVVGPRVDQYWEGTDALDHETQILLTRYCLDGELSRETTGAEIELKFNLCHDLGLLLCSAIYVQPSSGPPERGSGAPSKSVFCFMMRIHHVHRFVSIQRLVEDRLCSLTRRLRALRLEEADRGLERGYALNQFSELLDPFVAYVEVLFHSALGPVVFTNTLFVQGGGAGAEPEFLARCITSHLLTHGHSVVTGETPEEVNAMIDTLSLFLLPEEKRLCRRAPISQAEFEQMAFVPGLFIQGIHRRTTIYEDDLIRAEFPSTIIELAIGLVRQCRLYNEYRFLRKDFLDGSRDFGEQGPVVGGGAGYGAGGGAGGAASGYGTGGSGAAAAASGSGASATSASAEEPPPILFGPSLGAGSAGAAAAAAAHTLQKNSLLHLVKQPSAGIRQLVTEVFRLPAPLREAYIHLQHRLLLRKVVVLIRFVEAYKDDNHVTHRARLKTSLGFQGVDLDILLALAEKISPDIYVKVTPDLTALDEILRGMSEGIM